MSEEVKNEVYRRYLKGEIMEKNLAYDTAQGQLIDKLKMEFKFFIEKLQKEWSVL